jgi:hypothetical protein
MTPEEVKALFEQDGGDKEFKTTQLKHVLVTVKQLWETNSADLDLFAEQLGNGSRTGEYVCDICWNMVFLSCMLTTGWTSWLEVSDGSIGLAGLLSADLAARKPPSSSENALAAARRECVRR